MNTLTFYLKNEILKNSKCFLKSLFGVIIKKGNNNALLLIRIYQILSNKPGVINKIIARIIRNKLIKIYGIELSSQTKIGLGFKIGHANGIIIGEGVEIGDNVTIYHQVTLGLAGVKDKGKYEKYPKIGDGCIIYAGAKVLGDITLGPGTIIGANSVVLCDTETKSVYAGIPAKRIR